MAENYSPHTPARKAAAAASAARWGPELCEEDRGIGRTFWVYNACVGGRGLACLCVSVSVCVLVFVSILNQFELRISSFWSLFLLKLVF